MSGKYHVIMYTLLIPWEDSEKHMLTTSCPVETSQNGIMWLISLKLHLLTTRKKLEGLKKVGENNQKKNKVIVEVR